MGDEYLSIDKKEDKQQVSNMNTSGENLQATPNCASTDVTAVESKTKGVEAAGGSQVIPIASDGDDRTNTIGGQRTNYNFFQIHRTKIGLMILMIIFICIVIAFGVGMTSGKQKALDKQKNATGMVCL